MLQNEEINRNLRLLLHKDWLYNSKGGTGDETGELVDQTEEARSRMKTGDVVECSGGSGWCRLQEVAGGCWRWHVAPGPGGGGCLQTRL